MSKSNHDVDPTEVVEDGCGYSYDHSDEVTYEDDETIIWVCSECDAEGFEEK